MRNFLNAFPSAAAWFFKVMKNKELFFHHQLKTHGPRTNHEDGVCESWRETEGNRLSGAVAAQAVRLLGVQEERPLKHTLPNVAIQGRTCPLLSATGPYGKDSRQLCISDSITLSLIVILEMEK